MKIINTSNDSLYNNNCIFAFYISSLYISEPEKEQKHFYYIKHIGGFQYIYLQMH